MNKTHYTLAVAFMHVVHVCACMRWHCHQRHAYMPVHVKLGALYVNLDCGSNRSSLHTNYVTFTMRNILCYSRTTCTCTVRELFIAKPTEASMH